MNHTDIINLLIADHGYKSYLEIGLYDGANFRKIKADRKVSVDPDRNCKATHCITSDQFFTQNKERFDLVFIDGDHTAEQVERDIRNAIKIARTVVVHDLNPTTEEMQRVPRAVKQWTGDGWKAWVAVKTWLTCEMVVVDTDFGVGVIEVLRGTGPRFSEYSTIDYKDFAANRTELLNLITVEELCKKYNYPMAAQQG